MLYILTGRIQTGKTRWLESLAEDLTSAGVCPCGVLAPGVWMATSAGDGGEAFEKLGIDNKLLPTGRLVPLARRRDLAKAEGTFDEASQSARACLGWEMSDAALAEVNAHFDELALAISGGEDACLPKSRGACGEAPREAVALQPAVSPMFLIVDEIGPLELLRGEGLTSALSLLEKGPTAFWQHALVVVREALVEDAMERFAEIWGEVELIVPNDAAKVKILQVLSQ